MPIYGSYRFPALWIFSTVSDNMFFFSSRRFNPSTNHHRPLLAPLFCAIEDIIRPLVKPLCAREIV